jgi:hypothetical protein
MLSSSRDRYRQKPRQVGHALVVSQATWVAKLAMSGRVQQASLGIGPSAILGKQRFTILLLPTPIEGLRQNLKKTKTKLVLAYKN